MRFSFRAILDPFILLILLYGVFIGFVAVGNALPQPLLLLRILAGIVFTLFIPGFLLLATLFPGKETLDIYERIGLSFGLSVASVTVITLFLNLLPGGIDLVPIVIADGLVVLIFGAISFYHHRRIPPGEHFLSPADFVFRDWLRKLDRTERYLYFTLIFGFSIIVLAALGILLFSSHGRQFTEFYILGSEGLARDYPFEISVGETANVTVGITNQENIKSAYRIEVKSGDEVIGGVDSFELDVGQTIEETVIFTPTQPRDDTQIDFLLYRNGDTKPYRSLRLWMKVTSPR